MAKYLKYFPKPLLDDLVRGRWLPIVGAGMSLNAKTPANKKIPLWHQLGKALESDLADFSSNGAIDAISAFEHEFGRPRLIERLSEILLLREATPGDAHRQFCSIPFDLVCTTNFDFLLERQYDLIPRYVYPVVDEDQLSLNLSRDGTLLLKLHGDLRHPSRLVVTEADYDSFLTLYPLIATYLANLLITKTAVLMGYSLDDPDFRQVWQIVTQRLGKTRRRAYAIAVGAQAADVARFARRGVTVINLPGSREKYGEVLATTFAELGTYWRDNVLEASTVTEERPLREILLPKDASIRLCFFAVPLSRLTFYKERVFPEVESLGLVPVTADDVISPGDSINAKIDALMDRAVAIIVELGTTWTASELRIALSRSNDSRATAARAAPPIFVIVPQQDALPEFVNLDRVQTISIDTNRLSDDWVSTLTTQLSFVVPQELIRQSEPRRLFKAKEYRAAVIAAMTLLETTLRERLAKLAWTDVRRPMSLRNLVEAAANDGTIQQGDVPRINEWIGLRNEAVHSDRSITREQAQSVVSGVTAVLNLPNTN